MYSQVQGVPKKNNNPINQQYGNIAINGNTSDLVTRFITGKAYLRNIFAVFRAMTKIRKLNSHGFVKSDLEHNFFHPKQITRLADVAGFWQDKVLKFVLENYQLGWSFSHVGHSRIRSDAILVHLRQARDTRKGNAQLVRQGRWARGTGRDRPHFHFPAEGWCLPDGWHLPRPWKFPGPLRVPVNPGGGLTPEREGWAPGRLEIPGSEMLLGSGRAGEPRGLARAGPISTSMGVSPCMAAEWNDWPGRPGKAERPETFTKRGWRAASMGWFRWPVRADEAVPMDTSPILSDP